MMLKGDMEEHVNKLRFNLECHQVAKAAILNPHELDFESKVQCDWQMKPCVAR
jgi:hypothetical protein